MTVISIETKDHPNTGFSVYRIALSDGSLFSCKSSYLHQRPGEGVLYIPGQELSGDEERMLRFAAACFRAERAALRLVARAEQTSCGLIRKLEQRGHESSCVRAAVAHLSELEIIDDERYASLWLRARISRGVESPRSLIQALYRRGVSQDRAERALKPALDDETELLLLRRYLDKRISPELPRDSALRRELRREGFSVRVLDRWREEEGS